MLPISFCLEALARLRQGTYGHQSLLNLSQLLPDLLPWLSFAAEPQEREAVPHEVVELITADLLRGLVFLAEKNLSSTVVEVNPRACVFSSDGVCKLHFLKDSSEFQLDCCVKHEDLMASVYIGPEVFDDNRDKTLDSLVWSIGFLALQLLRNNVVMPISGGIPAIADFLMSADAPRLLADAKNYIRSKALLEFLQLALLQDTSKRGSPSDLLKLFPSSTEDDRLNLKAWVDGRLQV